MRRTLLALLAVAAAAAALVPRGGGDAGPGADELAGRLRSLYEAPRSPGERWRGGSPLVALPDGRSVPRERAYRDEPAFVEASAALLRSRRGGDAPLGAWLLGTAPPGPAAAAEKVLVTALADEDARLAFEAARALAEVGGPRSLAALAPVTREARDSSLAGVAAWASGRIRERAGADPPPARRERLLPASFRRGVSWWFEGEDGDGGFASFRTLRSLGVEWVSLHTWDPLQKAVDSPELVTAARRFPRAGLDEFVRQARRASLRVLLKPHLEMRGYEPTADERRILQGPDEAARRRLIEGIRRRRYGQERPWHGAIAMRNDADWRAWFRAYGEYVLAYARLAQASGADMFCVGRETDLTVLARPEDWRALIARVREVYPGPLTYSANFDSAAGLTFWDALDFIGVSAYYPLSRAEDPSLAELRAGWDRALPPLLEASRRFGRPVLFTEVGYPARAGAAEAPWREARSPADTVLQARLYEATLRAVAERPWIEGAFFWLWEGVTKPPFRDAGFTMRDKQAAFTMAWWYGGGP
jgi:hypothetical protein